MIKLKYMGPHVIHHENKGNNFHCIIAHKMDYSYWPKTPRGDEKNSIIEVKNHAVVSQKKMWLFLIWRSEMFSRRKWHFNSNCDDDYNFSWHYERKGLPKEMHKQKHENTKSIFKRQQACWCCRCGSPLQCPMWHPLGPPLISAAAAVDSLVQACLDSVPYQVPPRVFFDAVGACSTHR